jgi:hypothetical protein
MSTFYTLYTNTPLNVHNIEKLFGIDHVSQDILNIGIDRPIIQETRFIDRDFHFQPTISIVYHDVPGNAEQSRVAMINTVVALLIADASELVLLYQVDTVLLQRLQSSLILNDTGFWRPDYRALLPLPYTVEKLPDLP